MEIIGHQKITNLLNKSIAKNSVSHAYLFFGPESVGKFTVAREFAEKLTSVAEERGEINPNLVIIRSETEEKNGILKKKDIKVESVRELQRKLSLSSQGGKFKVAIIDDAERLTRTAQNAMLKTLEEPNERVVIILVAQDEKKMLPTILSRCQTKRFGLVSSLEILQFVSEKQHNRGSLAEKDAASEMIFWSFGRPGLLIKMMTDESELNFRKETLKELEGLFVQNVEEKFSLAEKMSKDIEAAIKKLNLWIVILRKFVLEGNSGIESYFIGPLRRIEASRRISRQKFFGLLIETGKSLALIKETNSNARLILENLFLNF